MCMSDLPPTSLSPFQKRAGAKGFGLFATKVITAGQFIIEYIGEVLEEEEYVRRKEFYLEVSGGGGRWGVYSPAHKTPCAPHMRVRNQAGSACPSGPVHGRNGACLERQTARLEQSAWFDVFG